MFEVNYEVAKLLIKEGKRVGKTPWCCCGITEDYVFEQLNGHPRFCSGIAVIQKGNTKITTDQPFYINGVYFENHTTKYPQETMEETCNRRKSEKQGT